MQEAFLHDFCLLLLFASDNIKYFALKANSKVWDNL